MSSIAKRLLVAGTVCAMLLVPAAATGAPVSKKVAKLKQQLKALQQQVDDLERQPGPPSGTAGGDLAGSYPNPSIAGSAVGSPEVANNSLGILDIGNNAVGTAEIGNGQVGTVDQAVVPAARVGSGDNDAEVADNTFEPINFEQESDPTHFDTANLHSTTTNTDRLTAPVSGLYYVHGHVAWGSSTDNDLQGLALEIVDDQGRRLSRDLNDETSFETGGFLHSQEVSTTVILNTGEYVQLHGFQDNGDNEALGWNTTDDFSPIFEMSWLGPAP